MHPMPYVDIRPFLISLALLTIAACSSTVPSKSKTPEEARGELGRLSIQYNEGSFIDCAKNGDLVAVELFLASGMSPNVTDPTGRLAYQLVPEPQTSIVKAMVDYAEAANRLGSGGSKNGTTPLMAASITGRTDVAKGLIGKGANVNGKDRIGLSALSYAAWGGQFDVAKLLIENGAQVTSTEKKQVPIMSVGVAGGNADVVKLLIRSGAKISTTDLGEAAEDGNREIVEALLSNGADINFGLVYPPHIEAAENGHSDVVQLLLARGANINAKDEYGQTALMHASRTGRSDLVRLLLDKGANPQLTDNDGRTALRIASDAGRDEVTQILGKASGR
jgi:ankyrin repeat protein